MDGFQTSCVQPQIIRFFSHRQFMKAQMRNSLLLDLLHRSINRMDPICAWITVCMTCGFQVLYNLWAGERALNRSECTTKAWHGGFKCRQEEKKLALTVRHANNKPTTEGVKYHQQCDKYNVYAEIKWTSCYFHGQMKSVYD
jgi:hypothetical protein